MKSPKNGLVVPFGSVEAKDADGNGVHVFQQGQLVPPGWTILSCIDDELAKAIGFPQAKSTPPKKDSP